VNFEREGQGRTFWWRERQVQGLGGLKEDQVWVAGSHLERGVGSGPELRQFMEEHFGFYDGFIV
jgi:hypothetical protein